MFAITIITSPRPISPPTDTYIEKDASINDEIDRLRHSATACPAGAPGRDHRGFGELYLLAMGDPSEYEGHDDLPARRA